VPLYSLFGLRVRADDAVPGLVPRPGGDRADLSVWLRGTSDGFDEHRWRDAAARVYVSADRDESGQPLLTVNRRCADGVYRLRYADGIAFLVDGAGREIRARWPEPWTVDDVATYLVGSVFAFALRLRGITCLHASAAAVEGRAVAFVGEMGAGKSTLVAALARRGLRTISDDVVALGAAPEGYVVHPGPPRIRLWPDSARALFGSTDALPRLTPSWDKRFVDLTGGPYRREERALPLAAIYLLDDRARDAASPRLDWLPPPAALLALVANTQANRLLDARMRAQEFRCLGRLVASLGVRRLVPPDGLDRLEELCDLVVQGAPEPAVHV
jgi:hypothetical protein